MLGYEQLPAGLRHYVLLVGAGGVAVAGLAAALGASRPSGDLLLQAGLLMVLAVVAERYPLHLTHKTNINVGTAAYIAMCLTLPVAWPPLLVVLSGLAAQVLLRRAGRPVSVPDALFNIGQTALYMAGAAIIYAAYRDLPIGPTIGSFGTVGAIAVASGVMHLVNTGLVAGAVGLQLGTVPLRVWSHNLALDLVPHVTLTVVGIIVAGIVVDQPFVVPFLALPLLLVQRSVRQTIRVRLDTHEALATLVDVVELRDPYTAGHSRRVATSARHLALRLGLTAEEADCIESAGRVHDIGKVAINPTVLTKPGRLTDDEWADMRRHPAVGAVVVERYPAYQDAGKCVRHHHEAWDGSGYPDGLAGDAIPLGARILAVADTFDALTSDRPYRQGMSTEQAMRILEDGAGQQWDPQVVATFLEILQSTPAAVPILADHHPAVQQDSGPVRESSSSASPPRRVDPVPLINPSVPALAVSPKPRCTSTSCPITLEQPPGERELRPVAMVYIVALTAAAIAITLFGLSTTPFPSPDRAILIGLLAVAGGAACCYPLPLVRRARIQLDTAVVVAAVLTLPLGLAALAAGAGPLLANLRRRESWQEASFNAAQTALQAITGSIILVGLGWQIDAPTFDWPQPLPAVVLIGLVLHAVNTAAVAGIAAFQERQSFPGTWRTMVVSFDRAEALSHLAQLGLGVLTAAVVTTASWLILLLLLPAVAVYGSLSQHVRLRLRAEEQVVHQAFHDALTDLPNRASFMKQLDEALAEATGDRSDLAVLFLDLDRFKMINDTLGHQAGDELLVEVGVRLRRAVRATDVVARLGGDEFTVLLTGLAERRQAERLAGRIAEEMGEPFAIAGQLLDVTTSIGIAFPSGTQRTAAELLRDADVALYQAKAAGRARYAIFDEQIAVAMQHRLALEIDLHRALERDQVRLVYQPRMELASGRIVAMEALLRWMHPVRGDIPPSVFLPIAEETGVIVSLGAWVLDSACRQAVRWDQHGNQTMVVSVNLSARQLRDPQLIDVVTQVLATTGLPAHRLQLEITEAAAADTASLAVLEKLKVVGVQLAIDDFGTGNASLSAVSRLPADTLQLDGAVVRELGHSREAATVAQAVIALAHGLDWTVVAEGVETAEQVVWLRQAGCDLVQGSHFAQPLTGEEAATLVAATRSSVSRVGVEGRLEDADLGARIVHLRDVTVAKAKAIL